MHDAYLSKVKSVIEEKSGIEPKDVHEGSFFEDDLNIGEMEFLEILQELEELYHVELLSRRDDIETVADLLDIIAEEID